MNVLEYIFWFSLFAIVYTYMLYPVLLIIIGLGVQLIRDVRYLINSNTRRVKNSKQFPIVAIVLSAFNEEKHIEQRLNNLLDLDYPKDSYKIYIGSDASDDNTNNIINSFTDSRIVFFPYQDRRGKVSVINDLIKDLDEDILVLSDANTMFDRRVIINLVRHFDEPEVGAVCGQLKLIDVDGNNADGVYWKIENVLKFYESRINGLLGANGANYAIRRSLYKVIPNDTIVDDFTIVMNIAEQGRKVIYDPEAISIEEIAPDVSDEFKRRVRIGIGNYQALSRLKKSIIPQLTMRYFTYISHKVMRWYVPHFMVLTFISSLLLIDNYVFKLFLIFQVLFYVYTVFAYFFPNILMRIKLLKFPVFVVTLNAAFAIAFFKYYFSKTSGAWNRTKR